MRFATYHVFQCPPGQAPARVMAEELERAELAEALGFDDVWVPEQHFSPYCLCGDALLMAGHLAARLRRVRIGTAVVNLTFTHPLRFALRRRSHFWSVPITPYSHGLFSPHPHSRYTARSITPFPVARGYFKTCSRRL